jgi:hypothetical protein
MDSKKRKQKSRSRRSDEQIEAYKKRIEITKQNLRQIELKRRLNAISTKREVCYLKER